MVKTWWWGERLKKVYFSPYFTLQRAYFSRWPEQHSIWREQEFGGIRSKYRNSCPTGIPAKKSCESSEKQEFPRPPPKPHSCEKILWKTQEKKEILRNPFFYCF
jgi:hypothetical protein